MKKLFLLFLLFSFSLTAQNNFSDQYRAYIEEHGGPGLSGIMPVHPDMILDSTSVWTSLTDATTPFGRCVIGNIGNYVYVFTGQGTTSLAIAYHIPTNTWVSSTPATASGYNAGFCVAAGELYKCSGTGSVSVFEKFTPAGDGTGTWAVLPSGPTSIMAAHNSLVWDNGNFIYAYTGSYTSPYPTYLVRYDMTTQQWETKTGSTYNKKYPGMAVIGRNIYLIGGIPAAGQGAYCEKYNMDTDTWTTIADLPEAVSFAKWSVTTDGNYVFLLGSGGGYSTYPASQNAWYYNPATNTWAQETLLPALRGLVNGLYLPNFNKLFWGAGNDGIGSQNYQVNFWEGTGGVYSTQTTFGYSINVTTGWNMLSIPGLHPPGNPWPGRDPGAGIFRFLGGYQLVTTLAPTIGYWMKNLTTETYTYSGIIPVPNNPIPMTAGWNLFGCYQCSILVDSITTTPPGLFTGQIYKFDGGYVPVDTLYPGYGYFVKLNGTGTFNLPPCTTLKDQELSLTKEAVRQKGD